MTAALGTRSVWQRDTELLRTLVERQLRLRSKRSVVGVVWPAVSPLVMLGLYSFVFNRVFSVPVERYPEFLLAGLLPWAFLAQAVAASISSLSIEAMLIKRAPFRHQLIPMAMILSMACYFVVTLIGFCAYLAYHGRLNWTLVPLLVLPTVAVILFVTAVGQMLALFDIYNRDLRWVIGNVLSIWFFLLPIVYQRQMAPSSLDFLRSVDPMNLIIGQYRDLLYFGSVPDAGPMILMLMLSGGFFAMCQFLFARFSHEIPKDV